MDQGTASCIRSSAFLTGRIEAHHNPVDERRGAFLTGPCNALSNQLRIGGVGESLPRLLMSLLPVRVV